MNTNRIHRICGLRHVLQWQCNELPHLCSALLIAAAVILNPLSARAEEAIKQTEKTETSNPPAELKVAPSLEQTNDFKSQPLAILAKFPDAGTAMARFVAQAVMREPVIADAVLSVVADSSPQQASAIGAGFVRAVRALAAKQPEIARAIARKIMSIENPWLKTTFFALGPTYSNAALTMPPNLPPPAMRMLQVGDELPTYESRLGPIKRQEWIRHRESETRRVIGAKSEGIGDTYAYGMIVAELTSDAPSNGAVSTSPTQ